MKRCNEIAEKVRQILNKKTDEFALYSEFNEYLQKFDIKRSGALDHGEAVEFLYDYVNKDNVVVCWDDVLTGGDDLAYYVVPANLAERMVVLGDLP